MYWKCAQGFGFCRIGCFTGFRVGKHCGLLRLFVFRFTVRWSLGFGLRLRIVDSLFSLEVGCRESGCAHLTGVGWLEVFGLELRC